jgi:hypothetical protein
MSSKIGGLGLEEEGLVRVSRGLLNHDTSSLMGGRGGCSMFWRIKVMMASSMRGEITKSLASTSVRLRGRRMTDYILRSSMRCSFSSVQIIVRSF